MFIVMWLLNFNAAARPVGLQGFHFRLLVATTNHAEKYIRPQLRGRPRLLLLLLIHFLSLIPHLQNLMLRRKILLEVRYYF